jgi:hypothetical protein
MSFFPFFKSHKKTRVGINQNKILEEPFEEIKNDKEYRINKNKILEEPFEEIKNDKEYRINKKKIQKNKILNSLKKRTNRLRIQRESLKNKKTHNRHELEIANKSTEELLQNIHRSMDSIRYGATSQNINHMFNQESFSKITDPLDQKKFKDSLNIYNEGLLKLMTEYENRKIRNENIRRELHHMKKENVYSAMNRKKNRQSRRPSPSIRKIYNNYHPKKFMRPIVKRPKTRRPVPSQPIVKRPKTRRLVPSRPIVKRPKLL